MLERRGDSFEPVQYIASDTVGGHGSGDIHLSPDERFLYTSNRLKADGIAVFAIDSATGRLTRTGYMATGPIIRATSRCRPTADGCLWPVATMTA